MHSGRVEFEMSWWGDDAPHQDSRDSSSYLEQCTLMRGLEAGALHRC